MRTALLRRSGSMGGCAGWKVIGPAFGQEDGGDNNQKRDDEISGGTQVKKKGRELQARAARMEIESGIADDEGKQQGNQHHCAEQKPR